MVYHGIDRKARNVQRLVLRPVAGGFFTPVSAHSSEPAFALHPGPNHFNGQGNDDRIPETAQLVYPLRLPFREQVDGAQAMISGQRSPIINHATKLGLSAPNPPEFSLRVWSDEFPGVPETCCA